MPALGTVGRTRRTSCSDRVPHRLYCSLLPSPHSTQQPSSPSSTTTHALHACTSRSSSSSHAGPMVPCPLHVANEATRALLCSSLGGAAAAGAQSCVPDDAAAAPPTVSFCLMRGPHGPCTPLEGHAEETLRLLGPDCGARKGVVRVLSLPDGSSVLMRPTLHGPVPPAVILKARAKRGAQVLLLGSAAAPSSL